MTNWITLKTLYDLNTAIENSWEVQFQKEGENAWYVWYGSSYLINITAWRGRPPLTETEKELTEQISQLKVALDTADKLLEQVRNALPDSYSESSAWQGTDVLGRISLLKHSHSEYLKAGYTAVRWLCPHSGDVSSIRRELWVPLYQKKVAT